MAKLVHDQWSGFVAPRIELECASAARELSEAIGGDMKKALLLLLTSIVSLCVPLYNVIEPRLFGFPFFYWFLLLLIPVSSLFTFLVYKREKR